MTTQQNNGRRRPSSVRTNRPAPRPPSFWPLPDGQPLTVCSRCSAAIPATERAEQVHRSHHETIAGLEDGRAR